MKMASPQNIARTLRKKFGSEETIVKLSEILLFLESYQNNSSAAGKQKQQQMNRGTQQDASPTRRRACDTTRKTHATQQTQQSPTPTTTTATTTTGKPQTTQEQSTKPSYADIARKAPKKPIQQPKPTKKAPVLPESIKLAPKALKPLKIGLRDPIRDTPSELLLKIKDRAVNRERLASLIRAFRVLTPRTLLVYMTTEAAKEELS